jgi:hypothetical protein
VHTEAIRSSPIAPNVRALQNLEDPRVATSRAAVIQRNLRLQIDKRLHPATAPGADRRQKGAAPVNVQAETIRLRNENPNDP